MVNETQNGRATVGADRIVSSMAAVRSRSRESVNQLQHELDRLTDWREYIRAYPVPLVASAVIAGFVLSPSRERSSTIAEVAMQPSLSPPNSVVGEATTVVVSALRNAVVSTMRTFLQRQIQAFVENLHHEQSTKQSDTL